MSAIPKRGSIPRLACYFDRILPVPESSPHQYEHLAARSEAERELRLAFASITAAREIELVSVRTVSGMPEAQVEQRRVILSISQRLCEGEFESHMDKLVAKWLEYRRLAKP